MERCIIEILEDKRKGNDCNENESAKLKQFVKTNSNKKGDFYKAVIKEIADLFIHEFSEALEEEELKEFQIEVCRTSYAHRTITVKAYSLSEAEMLAIDEAGSYEFSESDAEYSAN